jgi:hypothetical protein
MSYASKNLSDRQRQYIWLMGSFPQKIAVQGRGYRNATLMYGFDEDELVIFGYSSPFLWLDNRGLTRPIANHPRGRVLTDEGEKVFQRLLLDGYGARAPVREVKVVPKPEMA